MVFFFFFQAEDGIRDKLVTGVQTCALPICGGNDVPRRAAGLGAGRARRGGPDGGEGAGDGEGPARRRLRSPAAGARRGERSEERRVGKEGRSRGAADR